MCASRRAARAAGVLGRARPTDFPAQELELVRIAAPDCGSCHDMRLAGGPGLALTRGALADESLPALVAVT